jgi:hypothetical protein
MKRVKQNAASNKHEIILPSEIPLRRVGRRIAVDVSDARHSNEKTPDRIKSAALVYSTSHPTGVLETVVVVNLLGKKISSRRE